MTGYSRAQVNRLIAQHRDSHSLRDQRGAPAVPFAKRYGAAALRCLIEIDRAHGTLSGPATRKLAERAVSVHGQTEFEALSSISVSHLYNLRKSAGYIKARVSFSQTAAPRTPVAIGVRKRPDPQGRAGFLRIDSVLPWRSRGHEGDLLHQCRGLCDANSGRRRGRRYQRGVSAARTAVHTGIPAVYGAGLSLGQWQRVHQRSSGKATGKAVDRTDQITRAAVTITRWWRARTAQ